MQVVDKLKNGYTVKFLENAEDRKFQNEHCHQNGVCIGGMQWERYYKDGLMLYSLFDPDDKPIATILCGEAEAVLMTRAGSGYAAYMGTKTFDQLPRIIKSQKKIVVCLEAIPGRQSGWHSVGSDHAATKQETQIVKEWYENLPIAKDYLGWDANARETRTAAETFVRGRR